MTYEYRIDPKTLNVTAQYIQGEYAGDKDTMGFASEENVPMPCCYRNGAIVPGMNRDVLMADASEALTKSDITVIRCYAAGVAVPADMQAYRLALRALATGKDTVSTQLPAAPTDYPANT